LQAVTIVTSDLGPVRRFYSGALGMAAQAVMLDGAQAAGLATHWGFEPPEKLDMLVFRQPFAEGGAILRAVERPGLAPVRRPEYHSRYAGPLGFGFPMLDMAARQRIALDMGFRASAGIKRMDFPRADGSTYNVGEIHFLAPDNVMVLGVDRGDMAPVGPIDTVLGIGQIAYASCLVVDIEAFGQFLGDTVGLTRRRAIAFEGGGASGGMVGLELGEKVAFEQWYSGDAATGYLVVMKRLEQPQVPAAAGGFEGRGVAMWTFGCADLDAAVARHAATGGKSIVATVEGLEDVPRRSAVLRGPEGFLVELVESDGDEQ
jgi:catechol 2,3-dioxygenase-like lactoylglutathione lyase family enzyme